MKHIIIYIIAIILVGCGLTFQYREMKATVGTKHADEILIRIIQKNEEASREEIIDSIDTSGDRVQHQSSSAN